MPKRGRQSAQFPTDEALSFATIHAPIGSQRRLIDTPILASYARSVNDVITSA